VVDVAGGEDGDRPAGLPVSGGRCTRSERGNGKREQGGRGRCDAAVDEPREL
jgi:hypothetical protein